ncbi:helix-turn-helix domain-containing protein [Flavobacterium sp.]|uniref:helix-turn-helix domain-containing protein n=1 Tax=Flavobacterium sp. TaxID=239 RepID=UPI003BBCB56D
MFTNTILLITSILGFLSTALIVIKNRSKGNTLINNYLIIITGNASIRFLLHWISESYPELNINKLINAIDVSFIMLIPCYYLYFQKIIYEKQFELYNFFHFIAPFLLGCLFTINYFISSKTSSLLLKLFFILAILLYVFYAIIGFIILFKHVWRRKTQIKVIQKQNEQIKKWCLFLYSSFVLIFILRLVNGIFSDKIGNLGNNNLWMPALVWIVIFVKIILSPEILFGYDILNKTINRSSEKIMLNNVWNIEGNSIPIKSYKDKKLEDKIKSLILVYLHQMEELSFHTNTFRNPELSIDDIAATLKIPNSHVQYIIKFHCNESFSDYKKIVRINDATKLLQNEYLINHTVESLALKVGFSSYNTFIIAFKTITGVTVQDYVKRF